MTRPLIFIPWIGLIVSFTLNKYLKSLLLKNRHHLVVLFGQKWSILICVCVCEITRITSLWLGILLLGREEFQIGKKWPLGPYGAHKLILSGSTSLTRELWLQSAAWGHPNYSWYFQFFIIFYLLLAWGLVFPGLPVPRSECELDVKEIAVLTVASTGSSCEL